MCRPELHRQKQCAPAAIVRHHAAHEATIGLRQAKSVNNISEQDHRAIKRIVRPMVESKTTRSARILIAGIETVRVIRKGQLACPEEKALSAARQMYSLTY